MHEFLNYFSNKRNYTFNHLNIFCTPYGQKHVRAVSKHSLPLIDFKTRVFEIIDFKIMCLKLLLISNHVFEIIDLKTNVFEIHSVNQQAVFHWVSN